jgi:hypothetical protein
VKKEDYADDQWRTKGIREFRGKAVTVRSTYELKDWYEKFSAKIGDKNVSVTANRGMVAGMKAFMDHFLPESKDNEGGVGVPLE